MKIYPRYLRAQIQQDLDKKMVFLCGPRQVGKTVLAKSLLASQAKGYLNWDIPLHREQILKRELPPCDFWVFDEIHKYRQWRNYLKGLYDQFEKEKKILITGSAQLDYYRRGGDSLQGRYNFLRLYPLSAKEVGVSSQKELLELLKLGGFPEPFFSASEVDAKRWSLDYRSRLIEEDIISLEQVQDLGTLELLLINLPSYVASPLSLNSLREDLNVAHKTVSKWLGILERLYAIFRLPPFGSKGLRAVKKEQKHYHYDWTLVKEDGRRFENMVGLHLLKWCHFIRDTQGRDLVLKYFRDFDGREVDFVVVEEEDPLMFIECKWQDSALSKALKYLKNKFPHAQFYQISAMGIQDYISTHNIRVCPAYLWLQNLV